MEENRGMTSHEFWMLHAPDFNFELDERELVERAVSVGFIVRSPTHDGAVYNYAKTAK
jgi:hypothetical protein